MRDLIPFSGSTLDRASDQRADPGWIAARRADAASRLLPLYRGDPLLDGGRCVFLSARAAAVPPEAPMVFLGLDREAALFAVDVSAAPSAAAAPFADRGAYVALREAAAILPGEELAVAGQARWLLDWHRRHLHCARCGAPTDMRDGGARRQCASCGAEHFPRTDPVAIVLAVHDDACLLARSPRFPPGFLSALAGFVEACETPEECAIRELREEAGVRLSEARYQFSQPWPFPSSLMMGFIARAEARDLTLDEKEIVEARWISRGDIRRLLADASAFDFRLPPRFTIARRLIEAWAEA
jgi:NAD+ diphosphatase